MFLNDVCFNRAINVAHIGGSNSPFGIMRRAIKRGRMANVDLIKRGGRRREGAYLINRSGKISQYTTDNHRNQVRTLRLLKKPSDNVMAISG